jgi:hypothetical protein
MKKIVKFALINVKLVTKMEIALLVALQIKELFLEHYVHVMMDFLMME